MNTKKLIVVLSILFVVAVVYINSANALNLSKKWDGENKTLEIYNNANLAATIELVSKNEDLIYFEEIFNLTAYADYTFDDQIDFKTRWNVIKGNNDIISAKWYILKNVSYEVTVDDFSLIQESQVIPNITSQTNITALWFPLMGIDIGSPDSALKYKFNFSHNGTNYVDKIAGFDSWQIQDEMPYPMRIKIFWNETGVIGNHSETRYKNEWQQFSPIGKSMVNGNSYIFKLVYTKKAEIGKIKIQTLPMFMGFEEHNMTWWNVSWAYRIDNNVVNSTRPYQYSLNISNSSGTNNATHVFCNTHCNINFTDIRFTLDNTTLLPYWIENYTTGKVWINLTANGTVNMYYGNSIASAVSNITNTYPFGDDFSDGITKWSGDTGSFSTSGGELANTPTTSTKRIYAPILLANKKIELRMKTTTGSTDLVFGLEYRIDVSNRARYGRRHTAGYERRWGDGSLYYSTIPPQWTSGVYGIDSVVVGSTVAASTHQFDGTTVAGVVNYNTDLSANISLVSWGAGTPGIQYVDYIIVRNYVASEPTWSTWGTEDRLLVSIDSTSTARVFTIEYDSATTANWTINGTNVQSDGYALVHTYSNSTPSNGTWNITVVSGVDYGGNTTSQSWIWQYNIFTCDEGAVAEVREYVYAVII